MKYLYLPLFMAASAALCLAQAPSQNPKSATPAAPPKLALEDVPGNDPVVIAVGSEKLTKSEFERLLDSLPQQVRAQAAQPEGRRKIAEQMTEVLVLAQEARKRGLDKRPDTQQIVAFQTDSILASSLYRQLAENVKVDEAAERAYYDQHKADYEQVKASHILIRFKGSPVGLKPNEKDLTDAEALAKAQEIRKRLLAGEDFATIARTESDDATAAKQGGSVGTFSHGQMVPEFEKAAFALQAGQISEPVKTQFGYHIIKVETHENKTFEQVRPEIETRLKPQLAQQAADQIQKSAAVTLNEAYFGK